MLIRIAHLMSSMIVASTIVLNALFDFRQWEFYYDDKFKSLNNTCGFIMIISGILLLFVMKRNYPTEQERVWIAYFPLKFFLSVTVTPFMVRYRL